MIRTAIHHTLSAFAAVALVSALAARPAYSQNADIEGNTPNSAVGTPCASQFRKIKKEIKKEKTPKGLATKTTKQGDQLKPAQNASSCSFNAIRRKVMEGFNRNAEINAQATIQAAKEPRSEWRPP